MPVSNQILKIVKWSNVSERNYGKVMFPVVSVCLPIQGHPYAWSHPYQTGFLGKGPNPSPGPLDMFKLVQYVARTSVSSHPIDSCRPFKDHSWKSLKLWIGEQSLKTIPVSENMSGGLTNSAVTVFFTMPLATGRTNLAASWIAL